MENRENLDTDSEEFTQLRMDFVKQTKVSTGGKEMEMRRLEAYFSKTGPGDEKVFEETRNELIKGMRAFQSLVPEELRTTAIPASWSDVDTAVSTVQEHWESQSQGSKTSQAKKWFRKMCNGLHNHRAALDLLPKESEYVSVIAGAVTLIIKASANYTKISESFVKGVIAINDAVALVQGNQVYNTPQLQQLSMRLYTGVFSYLRKFMTWFTSKSRKRLLWSLNENLEQTFADDLEQVKSTSALLSQQIQLHMSIDVRISNLKIDKTNWALNYLISLIQNEEAQRRLQSATSERFFEKLFLENFQKSNDELKEALSNMMDGFKEVMRQAVSGEAMGNILERQASIELDTGDQHSTASITSLIDDAQNQILTDQSLNSTSQQEEDIKLWSAHLEDHYSSEQVYPFPDVPQQYYAETAFVSRLSAFTTTLESQILYAMAQFQPSGRNLLRFSAAKYANLARTHGVPVISFFCSPLPDEPWQLTALLYSLIRQIVELLGDDIPASAQLTKARFQHLDGSMDSWDEALRLFSDLVRWIRLPQLLFVIDGVNLLGNDSEDALQEKVRAFGRALKELAHPGAVTDCIFKVLFTTAGRSSSLFEELDSDQIVMCNLSSSVGAGGVSRKSRRFLLY
ncbi:hypothetical protein J7T55_005731 [Diaporthe amygdali]|uniref:uncharacterized protein n=1 Tax=Phomopsis amygdali TaxID=1214568 RepID=UPI0022FDD1B5|nr:uncharacterized protein J7T55_005731 [Diaporthe amygdali]KAJ0124393.1 hypothetical protein J7T55_005731 [Diaporthe amygdali]